MKTKEMSAKYQVVYKELKEAIVSGRIPVGEKVPSELQLMERYGFSRQTVRRALEELTRDGYVTKVRGSGSFVREPAPKGNGRKMVMLIALFAQQYFFPEYIGGSEQTLRENGYTLNVGISNNRTEEEAGYLREAMNNDYAGLILIPAQSAFLHSNLYLYRKIKEKGMPCVTLGSYLPYSGFPCVVNDDFEGGRLATNYLIERGHRRIACLMNSGECCGSLRYAGYQAALSEAGIEEEKEWTRWYVYEKFREFVEQEELVKTCLSGVTAVFCFNDELALAIIELLQKNGIRVPEDVSVVGYDGSYMCMFGRKKLTSVRQDPVKNGQIAAEKLLRMIENGDRGENIFLQPEILEGETVKTLEREEKEV